MGQRRRRPQLEQPQPQLGPPALGVGDRPPLALGAAVGVGDRPRGELRGATNSIRPLGQLMQL